MVLVIELTPKIFEWKIIPWNNLPSSQFDKLFNKLNYWQFQNKLSILAFVKKTFCWQFKSEQRVLLTIPSSSSSRSSLICSQLFLSPLFWHWCLPVDKAQHQREVTKYLVISTICNLRQLVSPKQDANCRAKIISWPACGVRENGWGKMTKKGENLV